MYCATLVADAVWRREKVEWLAEDMKGMVDAGQLTADECKQLIQQAVFLLQPREQIVTGQPALKHLKNDSCRRHHGLRSCGKKYPHWRKPGKPREPLKCGSSY